MTDAAAPQYTGPQRVFSGMQPTNGLHLGNYLGALKNWVSLQDQFAECIYCIVDLHAITADHDPKTLVDRCREVAAAYIAAGVDPKRSIVFIQSAVREHTELTWIFNSVARMGWMERMTQFKDKAGKHAERMSVGLFDYPVLQAADILLYKATHVPVGEDQKQHLELSRDIAQKFNNDFNAPNFFPLPKPLIQGPGARIMSLRDGTKKMSKSDPSDASRINMTDDADTILQKIKRATTDPNPLPESAEGLKGRAEVQNLIGIYAAVTGHSTDDVLAEFGGKGFGVFKPALAETLASHLSPIAAEMRRLNADPAALDAVLKEGAERARAIAAPIMADVRRIVGFSTSPDTKLSNTKTVGTPSSRSDEGLGYGIGPKGESVLASMGIATKDELLSACSTIEKLELVAARSGISHKVLKRCIDTLKSSGSVGIASTKNGRLASNQKMTVSIQRGKDTVPRNTQEPPEKSREVASKPSTPGASKRYPKKAKTSSPTKSVPAKAKRPAGKK